MVLYCSQHVFTVALDQLTTLTNAPKYTHPLIHTFVHTVISSKTFAPFNCLKIVIENIQTPFPPHPSPEQF